MEDVKETENNVKDQKGENSDDVMCDEHEEYNPSRPNVLEILQSAVPPGFTLQQHGQSEVITGPGGRRFIAQLYEQAPTEGTNQPAISSSETGDSSDTNSENEQLDEVPQQNVNNQDEGDMARTLCVNLLSELVKGSYQLFKSRSQHLQGPVKQEAMNKLTCIKKSCDDIKESLSGDTDKKQSNDTSETQESSHFTGIKTTNTHTTEIMTNTELSNTSLLDIQCANPANNVDIDDNARKRKIDNSEKSRSNSPTNFKKAKYGWQIKGARNNHDHKETDKVVSPSSSTVTNSAQDNIENMQTTTDKVEDKSSPLPNPSITKSDSENEETSEECSNRTEAKRKHVTPELSADESQNSEHSASSARNETSQFTYLERWQNHHIAKAIVDNAINKTLDEIDLGPQDGAQNQTGSSFSRQRQRIEDAGVSQVILQRGLRQPGARPLRPPASGTINPFINHLTEMTENMFVENLSQGMRFSARIDMAGNVQFDTRSIHESGSIMSDNIAAATDNSNVTRQISAAAISVNRRQCEQPRLTQITNLLQTSNEDLNQSDKSGVSSSTDNVRQKESDSLFSDLTPSTDATSCNECSMDVHQSNNSDSSLVNHNLSLVSHTDNCKNKEDNIYATTPSVPSDEIIIHNERSALDVIEEIEKTAPSQNFVLDTAVNAVIYERGLQF